MPVEEQIMAEMGKYCKAYMIDRFRAFPGWRERSENARKNPVDGSSEGKPRVLGDDVFLYLQENYTVTDGIYIDEHIIFDMVTEEWRRYCNETLGFEIPVYETVAIEAVDKAPKDGIGE